MRRATASSSVSRRRRQQEEEDDTHSAAPITQNSQQQQQQHGPPPMGSCMICTTVVQEGSLLAFACYDEERNEILLETCITENGIDCIERFLEVAKPNLLLLSNKILQNEILLQVLTSSSSEESEEAQSSSTPYRLLKSSTFDIRGCKARILQNLRVLSLSSGYDGHDGAAEQAPGFRDGRAFPVSTERFNKRRPSAYHSLAALIDFDCKPQIQAVGSLVSFLQESVFRLAEDEGFVTVDRIVLAKSHDFMRINASTLSSLHIFSTEHHPLLASKGRGNSKEGWSLFSLLDRTKSKGGRKLLKDWMLRPLIDLEAIQERQNAVELFLQPTFQTYAGILLSLLGKIGPIDSILLKMTKCSTQSNNFLTLAKALVAALSISATLTNDILPRLQQDCSFAYLTQIASSCHADVLLTLQERIATVIDDQATLNSSAVVIRRGFHPQLDKWKDQYEDLDVMLEDVAEDYYTRFPHLKDLSVVFVPQVGFLICLDKHMILQVELPMDFTHIFNQDDEAFFKNTDMRQLDQDIGDLDGIIKDTEGIIVAELEEFILEHSSFLRISFQALSNLDCILAFASCAMDLNFTKPQMVDSSHKKIHIKCGRHPLQEIITDFIPNNIRIDNEERLVIVSGPNFSGKSCYLRQVGLLVYMAHLGCFVPCEEAIISISDQICARICTVETCAVPQSSFQLDLTQMASILHKVTSKSLVLIDEFGKGTSPASGIAILGATLQKLSEIGCPTVCTTHFLEIFSMDILQDCSNGFKARRMAIQLPNDDNEEQDATPLFKLEDGVASSSAGLICAKRAGLNPKIVSRAGDIIQTISARHPILPLKEAMLSDYYVTGRDCDMLKFFFSVNSWQEAGEEDLRILIHKICQGL